MPRSPRLTLADQAHHVIQRGNNKQAIFFCDADRTRFLADLGDTLEKYNCALHAYVLMTNHIHLLVTPRHDDAIGKLMQALGRRYVGHINQTYGRTGTLWEGRFKSTIVKRKRGQSHLLTFREGFHLATSQVGVAYGDRYVPGHEVDSKGDVESLVAHGGDAVGSAEAAALFTMGAWGD